MARIAPHSMHGIAVISTVGFFIGTVLTALGFSLNVLVRYVNDGCMPARNETSRRFIDNTCYTPLNEDTRLPLLADHHEMTIGLFTDRPTLLDAALQWWVITITTATPPFFGYYSVGDAVQWLGETVRVVFGLPFFLSLGALLATTRKPRRSLR